MTTINALRTGYLNQYLGGRVDGSAQPWSDTLLNQLLTDAITRLWPDFGDLVFGEVATDGVSQVFTVPAAITNAGPYKISRIVLREGAPGDDGTIFDNVSGWRAHPGNKFLSRTVIASGLTFGVYAFVAFTVTTLPTTLEHAIGLRAASFAYGALGGQLVDSQRQQNLDSGRVVSYADAVGLSAYYERQYQEATIRHPNRVAFAPRASNRSR